LFLNVEIIFKILTCAIQSLVSKCLTLSFVIYLTFLSSKFFFSSTFLNKTKFKSTTCGAGKISSAGQGSCVSCDAGKAPNIDKNACENCAAGTYELNNICTPCAVGYMQDVAAQTSCKICPGKA